jgi:GTP cyclohydrolase II
MSVDDKITKLQAATEKALLDVVECQKSVQESEKAVNVVKALLRDLDKEEQQRVKVTDTKLPELLAMLIAAREANATAVTRYETNKRYLELCMQKAGQPTNEDSLTTSI